MIHHRIADFTDAYANTKYIAGGDRYPALWAERAASWREKASGRFIILRKRAYGPHERNHYDLFLPEGTPRGLVIFVHGGYWMSLDPSFWSHLAEGAVSRGYAVAMPGYVLCPEVRISDISRQVAEAISHAAALVEGPIHLSGHSAGGNIVTRLMAAGSPLPETVQERVASVLSISGLHDLRPLLATQMNATLRLDAAEAAAQSPVLLAPRGRFMLATWAGGAERSEFLRQSALLSNIWTGFGISTANHVAPDRHHFNVLDALEKPESALTRALLSV
ncbi:alpha/beta hydrolase [Haematobacter massiliensis]|uniref:Esterase n=1 Tax=Haematobacter massiliensis TaxID=195105 RepID=A0A086YA42_9RHOB|nr:alpha/beta hydrolase [Haematobacter massiliensis]KFI31142.1 esterase [Haematobacter massiliensis]OWJ69687.1 alpha/beta hydrolase [Haematobacter massiliensis]OWJ88733.1 alpha/beta hydrolase [Haematobacter massiliensis]QBJ23222.1 alpha/beta hydrolase [Haematobacter massiliensis]